MQQKVLLYFSKKMKPSEELQIVAIILFQAHNSNSELFEYDYDEYNEVLGGKDEEYEYHEQAATSVPEFLSIPTNLVVDEGESFKLPCLVSRMEEYVLMWMKEEAIISLADQILQNQGARYSLEYNGEGSTLVVTSARLSERGTYYCQMSSYNLARLQHTVSVRVQPVIEIVPSGEVLLKEGDSLQLFCDLVAGEPYPDMYWMIRNTQNDTEHLDQQLELTNVTRHHTGQYVCLADNGFGLKPVSREVTVIVLYAPEIEIEQGYLQSTSGGQIYISCIVQSSSEARVTWSKDGQTINPVSDKYSITASENTHNLILLTMTVESFGVYSCQVKTSDGISEKSSQVSELGCWSTHQTKHLDEEDLHMLSSSGHIVGANVLYGIVCTQPFSDFLDDHSSSSSEEEVRDDLIYSEDSLIEQHNESKLNVKKVDIDVEERKEVLENTSELKRPNKDSHIVSTESRTETVHIQIPSDSIELPSNDKQNIEAYLNNDENDKVFIESPDKSSINFDDPKNSEDSNISFAMNESEVGINSLKSKFDINETIDATDENITDNEKHPPENHDATNVSNKYLAKNLSVIDENENKQNNEQTNENKNKQSKTDKAHKNSDFDNQTFISNTKNNYNVQAKSNNKVFIESPDKSSKNFDDPKNREDNNISFAMNESEVGIDSLKSKFDINEIIDATDENITDNEKHPPEIHDGTNVSNKYLAKNISVIDENENKQNNKQTNENKNKQSKADTVHNFFDNQTFISKPKNNYNVQAKSNEQNESITSLSQVIKIYKSKTYKDCRVMENTVIENDNLIGMTIRSTGAECHQDCQAAPGCLGWWLGQVGGVQSCVLYGCGSFRQMVQHRTVAATAVNCLVAGDGVFDMEDLYSCQFSDVGGERFERIVQGRSSTLCGDIIIIGFSFILFIYI